MRFIKKHHKLISVILAGMLLCALSGCTDKDTNSTNTVNDNTTSPISASQLTHFNLKRNLANHEIVSPKLTDIFVHSLKNKSISRDGFIIANNKVVKFAPLRFDADTKDYHKDAPDLISSVKGHTITFMTGRRNVTYKLFYAKNEDDLNNRNSNGGKDLILIPIQDRIHDMHEKRISHQQGLHYLVRLQETEKLSTNSHSINHHSHSHKLLPN